LAGVLLCAALTAGSLAAQDNTSGSASASDQTTQAAAPPTYKPVDVDTLGSTPSAQRLVGSYVKVADYFYGWVPIFPNDALRIGFSPQEYAAFRTPPIGSNLICFVPIALADAAAFQNTNPVRGTEIFIMGRVYPRVLTDDGYSTAFLVDRVVLGHEEPRATKAEAKKSVVITVEKVGPDGVDYKLSYTVKTPGQPFWLPDPSDPDNNAKKLRVTLQF
jgi:hypothetical protein